MPTSGQDSGRHYVTVRGRRPSQYRGVTHSTRHAWDTWNAQISVSGRQRFLGSYRTETEAALAYDAAARKAWLYGRLNFPTDEERTMASNDVPKTFTAWLRAQEYRTDATGQLAQFWRDHTPGRISAVAGVQKHLTALRDSPHSGGDLSAEAATCLAFLDGAVREYEAARSGRPPLAAVPEPVVFPVQPENVIALPDGSYVDTSATPWRHVVNEIGDSHVTGQCEACMPAVRAVVPDQEGLWPAERAGDGTVPAAAADRVLFEQPPPGSPWQHPGEIKITGTAWASGGTGSPVREAIDRATAAGVSAAQAHAVSNAQHERNPHPFDVALARIESKLDRVLAVLGLDDESMTENIAAEIDPDMAADLEDATRPYARPDSHNPMVHDVLALDRKYGEPPADWPGVPQADDFARLYELADFGEEG